VGGAGLLVVDRVEEVVEAGEVMDTEFVEISNKHEPVALARNARSLMI
jgi:hypothetical protein